MSLQPGTHNRVWTDWTYSIARGGAETPARRTLVCLFVWFCLCRVLVALQASLQLQSAGFSRADFSCCRAPGIEPVSSALAGGFFTTEPLGKPQRIPFFSTKVRVACSHSNGKREEQGIGA